MLGFFSIIFLITLALLISQPIGNQTNFPRQTPTEVKQQDFVMHFLDGTVIKEKNYSEMISGNLSDIEEHVPSSYTQYLCNFSGNFSSVKNIGLKDDRVKKTLKEGGILEGIYFYEPPCHSVSPRSNAPCGCSYPTIRIRGPSVSNMINKNWIKGYADYLIDTDESKVEGIICHYSNSYSPDSTYVQFCRNDCDTETCREPDARI